VNKNDLAMTSFATAFTTEKLMKVFYAAYIPEWPKGEARWIQFPRW
jgi:hypothetical protein